jgi:hypothetical protein
MEAAFRIPSYLLPPVQALNLPTVPDPEDSEFHILEVSTRVSRATLHTLLSSEHTEPLLTDPDLDTADQMALSMLQDDVPADSGDDSSSSEEKQPKKKKKTSLL